MIYVIEYMYIKNIWMKWIRGYVYVFNIVIDIELKDGGVFYIWVRE